MLFQGFRRFLEAIKALTSSLERLAQLHDELGPALDRLDTLERLRHQFEAECEGKLLKADGKLKAASSAEQRERQLKKANERTADPFDPDGAPEPENGTHVHSDDAQAGAAPRVPPVRLALATNDKAHAVRAKWGVS